MKWKPGNETIFQNCDEIWDIFSDREGRNTFSAIMRQSPLLLPSPYIVCWPSCRCKWNTMTLISISHVISSSVPRGCSLESLQPSSITVNSPTQYWPVISTFLSCAAESYDLLLNWAEAAVDALNLFLLNLLRFWGRTQKNQNYRPIMTETGGSSRT